MAYSAFLPCMCNIDEGLRIIHVHTDVYCRHIPHIICKNYQSTRFTPWAYNSKTVSSLFIRFYFFEFCLSLAVIYIFIICALFYRFDLCVLEFPNPLRFFFLHTYTHAIHCNIHLKPNLFSKNKNNSVKNWIFISPWRPSFTSSTLL